MNRTEDDLTAMAEEWLAQNRKTWADVRTMQLPIGFVSTLAEHMDEPGKRRAGNWFTARTFVKQEKSPDACLIDARGNHTAPCKGYCQPEKP